VQRRSPPAGPGRRPAPERRRDRRRRPPDRGSRPERRRPAQARRRQEEDRPRPTRLVCGESEMVEITEGMKAPAFDLPAAGGGRVSLDALKGKAVVLYFYPKDDTPGCTREGQDFSALADDFAAAGAVVVGVSKDTVKKHDR